MLEAIAPPQDVVLVPDPWAEADPALVESSLEDLKEDLDELRYLVAMGLDKLRLVAGDDIYPETAALLASHVQHHRRWLVRQLHELDKLDAGTVASIALLTERKRTLFEGLRATLSLVAALLTSTDWQSPSFEHSVHSMAGRYTGAITEHHDDYKRDRHADAAGFERAYLREYAGARAGDDLRALMTNCGMAAFTTVLALVERAIPSKGNVLVGASTYHECRDLILNGPLKERVVLVDEASTQQLLAVVSRTRPVAIFLDSLCNAKGIRVPDLEALIGRLQAQDTLLVIDNTGLSVAFRCARLQRSAGPLRIITHESLTKYPQWGLDKVTAGMIVAPEPEATELSDLREHLGTNVCDASVHVLPAPDRRRFERRLRRLGRNARVLAEHVQRCADGGVVTGATYPGLDGHPGRLGFEGGFFAIDFGERFDHLEVHRRFLSSLFAHARKQGVQLTAGASFGLNSTRVYLTAATSEHGAPFVRVAAGTEHLLEVEDLKRVLSSAIEETARRVGPYGTRGRG